MKAVNSRKALVEALTQLLGRIALIVTRDDCPAAIRAELAVLDRVEEVRAALALAAIRPVTRQEDANG